MAPSLLFSKSKTDKSPWSYPNTPKRTAGAFRAVAVSPLLVGAPTIKLYEWSSITYKTLRKDKLMRGIKYAAISHVWKVNEEIPKPITPSERLDVKIKGPPPLKEISWEGLTQAARAAQSKGASYFWLDFLCLDQPDGKDIGLQIALMASIYKNASWVIIMIAGIDFVGKLDHQSAWIDRAWTLQEAVINYKKGTETYVYVQWPRIFTDSVKDSEGNVFTFYRVNGDDCLIKFRDMLDLADIDLKTITGSSKAPEVTILNSQIEGSGDVPRRVLHAAAFARKPRGRDAARWRSMYLRQSSTPADIVYSLMGCLGIEIDPFRNYRSPEFLFNDLARKSAVVNTVGPAWLTISGVTGIKTARNKESYLIPRFPNTLPDNPSNFKVNGKRKNVAKYIDTSANYIVNYDIKFVTQSHPHIISAKMLNISAFVKLKSSKGQGKASMSFGKISGTCFYRGGLSRGIVNNKDVRAVYVGDVGDMDIPGKPKANQAGNKYFLFLEWRQGWRVLGDGTFRKKGGLKWKPGKERWMFTVGQGSQINERRWLQESTSARLIKWLKTGRSVDANDLRKGKFAFHNYGFIRLKDVHPPKAVADENTPIIWLGRQKQFPKKSTFKRYTFKIRTTNIVGVDDLTDYFEPEFIRFVACNTNGAAPPTDMATAISKGITVKTYEPIEIQYVHYGWDVPVQGKTGRDLVSGIKIPDLTKKPVTTVMYYVKIQFGKRVIFFTMKQALKTKLQYHQVYIRCYGQHGGRSLNRNGDDGRGEF